MFRFPLRVFWFPLKGPTIPLVVGGFGGPKIGPFLVSQMAVMVPSVQFYWLFLRVLRMFGRGKRESLMSLLDEFFIWFHRNYKKRFK